VLFPLPFPAVLFFSLVAFSASLSTNRYPSWGPFSSFPPSGPPSGRFANNSEQGQVSSPLPPPPLPLPSPFPFSSFLSLRKSDLFSTVFFFRSLCLLIIDDTIYDFKHFFLRFFCPVWFPLGYHPKARSGQTGIPPFSGAINSYPPL